MALRWSQGNRNVLERILNPKMSESEVLSHFFPLTLVMATN